MSDVLSPSKTFVWTRSYVEYVLGEPHSYCVWISKKSEGVTVLPAGRKQIEELTRKFLDETRATGEQEIRDRAYEIYLQRGAQPGYELEDWLQAEREMPAAWSVCVCSLKPERM